jgi:CRISPR system Cascade subunit CasE
MSFFSQVELQADDRQQIRELNGMRENPYKQHQALWKLFRMPEVQADPQPFVFRDMHSESTRAMRFLLVSELAPKASSDLWVVRSKPFAPALQVDQSLRFQLRMNPTRSIKASNDPKARGKRQDWVMSMLNDVPLKDRAKKRQQLIFEGLPQWFAARSEQYGFVCKTVEVQNYENLGFAAQGHHVSLGVADFVGELVVTDLAKMQHSLLQGIGHGKGFGLGLLLVKS